MTCTSMPRYILIADFQAQRFVGKLIPRKCSSKTNLDCCFDGVSCLIMQSDSALYWTFRVSIMICVSRIPLLLLNENWESFGCLLLFVERTVFRCGQKQKKQHKWESCWALDQWCIQWYQFYWILIKKLPAEQILNALDKHKIIAAKLPRNFSTCHEKYPVFESKQIPIPIALGSITQCVGIILYSLELCRVPIMKCIRNIRILD